MSRFSQNCVSCAPEAWKLTLILDNLRSAHNVGNILRLAEALQLEVIGCGCTPMPPHPLLVKTAMECDKSVPCKSVATAVEAIELVRSNGCRCVWALEHTADSCEVWEVPEIVMPMALVLGNEARGISPEALVLCDREVDLAMLGEKASINVGNAAAAALYAIYARYKQLLKI